MVNHFVSAQAEVSELTVLIFAVPLLVFLPIFISRHLAINRRERVHQTWNIYILSMPFYDSASLYL
jgi:hypothetical protein